MKEIWKDIPKYEGLYQGSTEGHIRRLTHKVYIHGKFGGYHTIKGHILKPTLDGEKYYNVTLVKHGIKRTYRISRIICTLFHKNVHHCPEVDHINGCVWDNRAINLRWCFSNQNNRFSLRRKHLRNAKKHYDTLVLLVSKNYYGLFPTMASAARHVKLHQKASSLSTISNHLDKVASKNDNRRKAYGYTCEWYTKPVTSSVLLHEVYKLKTENLLHQNRLNAGQKKIVALIPTGNIAFKNSTEAAKWVIHKGLAHSKLVTVRNSIMAVCRGRRKHCYKLSFRFE